MEKEIFRRIHQLQTSGWWFGNARNKLVITLLKDRYHDLKKIKILDVGSSEGAFLDYLKKEKANFKAIDLDKNAIDFCRERGLGSRIKYGSILDIPFKKESFDIVTALDVIEHVKDDKKALREMKRVCKKKGVVFLIVPAHPWLFSSNDIAYHHYRRYDIKRIRHIAELNKLEVICISHFNIFLFPVFVFFTLISKIFPNKNSNVLKPAPILLNSVLTKVMDVEIDLVRKNVTKGGLGPIGGSYVVILRKNNS